MKQHANSTLRQVAERVYLRDGLDAVTTSCVRAEYALENPRAGGVSFEAARTAVRRLLFDISELTPRGHSLGAKREEVLLGLPRLPVPKPIPKDPPTFRQLRGRDPEPSELP